MAVNEVSPAGNLCACVANGNWFANGVEAYVTFVERLVSGYLATGKDHVCACDPDATPTFIV